MTARSPTVPKPISEISEMPNHERFLTRGLRWPASKGHFLVEMDGNSEALRHDVEQIFKLTDPSCCEHIDAEYAELVRKICQAPWAKTVANGHPAGSGDDND